MYSILHPDLEGDLLTGRETHQREGGKKKGKSNRPFERGTRNTSSKTKQKKTTADSKSMRIEQNKNTKKTCTCLSSIGQ
jgi:hypothetical protein